MLSPPNVLFRTHSALVLGCSMPYNSVTKVEVDTHFAELAVLIDFCAAGGDIIPRWGKARPDPKAASMQYRALAPSKDMAEPAALALCPISNASPSQEAAQCKKVEIAKARELAVAWQAQVCCVHAVAQNAWERTTKQEAGRHTVAWQE
eukprot:4504775-Amphidinium_carterae.4